MSKQIDVVGAVIVRDGMVLCTQRGPSGNLPYKWEFPGGKIEPGETAREALKREIDEELKCTVAVGEEVEITRHHYDFATITLTTFYCELLDGLPQLMEHAEARWVLPSEIEYLDWAPADTPAIAKIKRDLVSPGPASPE